MQKLRKSEQYYCRKSQVNKNNLFYLYKAGYIFTKLVTYIKGVKCANSSYTISQIPALSNVQTLGRIVNPEKQSAGS